MKKIIRTKLTNAYGVVMFVCENENYYMRLDNYGGSYGLIPITKELFDEAQKMKQEEMIYCEGEEE